MPTSRSRRVLMTSLASVLALPALAASIDSQDAGAGKVHCYGVNKCKETGDCGGPGHGCANQNACKRQGYIDMDKDTCLRLDGGRLTPNEDKKPAETPKKKGDTK